MSDEEVQAAHFCSPIMAFDASLRKRRGEHQYDRDEEKERSRWSLHGHRGRAGCWSFITRISGIRGLARTTSCNRAS